MTDPTTTARSTPSGLHLTDGFPSKIACASDPDIAFWEVEVKPFSMDNGDKIDQTTMFNTAVMTSEPQSLVEIGDITGSAAYDPKVYDEIMAIIGSKVSWTLTFSNSDTWDVWASLSLFDPQTLVKGSQPRANFTIQVHNRDTAALEVSPNYKTSVGTD